MVESPYAYSPPCGRLGVSGLHCTMPKGASAPGKVLPPWLVPRNGLTTDAGSVTAAAAGDTPANAVRAVATRAAAQRNARRWRSRVRGGEMPDRDIDAAFLGRGDNVDISDSRYLN